MARDPGANDAVYDDGDEFGKERKDEIKLPGARQGVEVAEEIGR